MPEPKKIEFSFPTVDDFIRAVRGHENQVGFFLDTHWDVKVGERVNITVSVSGVRNPIFLDGMVIWHRARAAKNMKAGSFVELVARDRARLDSIIEFLRKAHAIERRRHRRFPVNFPATYKTAKGDYSSNVYNISEGGAFLRCLGPLLTVGAQFPLILFPPTEKNGLPLMGRVAWIDFFEETQGMGVAFLDDQAQLRKIKKVISNCAKNLRDSTRRSAPANATV